jgi:hypothetical protein
MQKVTKLEKRVKNYPLLAFRFLREVSLIPWKVKTDSRDLHDIDDVER